MVVRTPLAHSSVPVLAMVQDSRQMERNVLVCITAYLAIAICMLPTK